MAETGSGRRDGPENPPARLITHLSAKGLTERLSHDTSGFVRIFTPADSERNGGRFSLGAASALTGGTRDSRTGTSASGGTGGTSDRCALMRRADGGGRGGGGAGGGGAVG